MFSTFTSCRKKKYFEDKDKLKLCLKCDSKFKLGNDPTSHRAVPCDENRCYHLDLITYVSRVMLPSTAGFLLQLFPQVVVCGLTWCLLSEHALDLLVTIPGKATDLFSCFPPFTDPMDPMCVQTLKNAIHKSKVRTGRISGVFIGLGMALVFKAIHLLVPANEEEEKKEYIAWYNKNKKRLRKKGKSKKEIEAIEEEINNKKREIMPSGGIVDVYCVEFKKRSHMKLISVIFFMYIYTMITVSRLKFVKPYLYAYILMLKVFRQVVEYELKKGLREFLHMSSFLIAYSMMEVVVCFSATGMISFVCCFIMVVFFDFSKRLWVDPRWYKKSRENMKEVRKQMLMRTKFFPPKGEQRSKALEKEWKEIRGKEDTIRDLQSSSIIVSCALTAPFWLGLYLWFPDALDVIDSLGLAATDLEIYLMFSALMLTSCYVVEMFITHVLEIRYRRRHRIPLLIKNTPNGLRFLQHYDSVPIDLSLSDSIRSLDQVGFTAQYYYMSIMLANGIMMLILGMTMFLSAPSVATLDLFFYVIYILFAFGITPTMLKITDNLVTVLTEIEEVEKDEILEEIHKACTAHFEENWPEGALVERLEQIISDSMFAREQLYTKIQEMAAAEGGNAPAGINKGQSAGSIAQALLAAETGPRVPSKPKKMKGKSKSKKKKTSKKKADAQVLAMTGGVTPELHQLMVQQQRQQEVRGGRGKGRRNDKNDSVSMFDAELEQERIAHSHTDVEWPMEMISHAELQKKKWAQQMLEEKGDDSD
jgi:hypothetical protein